MAKKLDEMRLPDLWALFKKLTGRENRSPNKAFLIKSIKEAETKKRKEAREAREAREAQIVETAHVRARGMVAQEVEADDELEEAPRAGEADEPEGQSGSEAEPGDAREDDEGEDESGAGGIDPAGGGPRAGEIVEVDEVAAHDVVAEVPSDEAEEAGEPDTADEEQPAGGEGDGGEEETAEGASAATAPAPISGPAKRGRFAGMTIEQLQALYLDKVGRPTDSVHRNYLTWKIREAEKGRITVGPARAKAGTGSRAAARRFADVTTGALQVLYTEKTGLSTDSLDRNVLIAGIVEAEKANPGPRADDPSPYGSERDKRVVPLQLPKVTIKALDIEWRQHGYRSRIAFLRAAIRAQLIKLGADETAAMFNV